MRMINPLSIASYNTKIYFNEIELGTATAFAYKHNNNKYLVTNYHVAYGINPETKKVINSMGAIPNKIECNYYTKDLKSKYFRIDYIDDTNPFKYISKDGNIIDIAIYQLPNSFDGVCINEIGEIFNEPAYEDKLNLKITECLYVLGYPRGINVEETPIWKRSSIASEPDLDINGVPSFYIDTTTREGMSGAPVIIYCGDGNYRNAEGTYIMAGYSVYKFIGIYSGRDRNDEPHIAQLGRVWKRELIDTVIEA